MMKKFEQEDEERERRIQERLEQEERLAALNGNLMESGFYGKLLICFEAGKITSVKKEESIKI